MDKGCKEWFVRWIYPFRSGYFEIRPGEVIETYHAEGVSTRQVVQISTKMNVPKWLNLFHDSNWNYNEMHSNKYRYACEIYFINL